MPDILDANGLQVKTLPEIIAELETGLRAIYGADINLDQNSPDGQMVNLYAQSAIDQRETLVSVNSAFDPDAALGSILDARVAINFIQRQGGTYTIQPITLVISQTVTLQGLDANFNDPNGTGYTVSDNSGNQFILVDTATLTAGTHSINFRAKNIGLVETVVNTITNPVTIILGVTSINNPSAALEIGQNEESDAQLRVRRQKSVALASSGYLNGILGSILALSGVTDARVFENFTLSTDSNGIPAHSMWAIVEGGANTDIANVIYNKKSFGCGMKGAVTNNIATPSGGVFVARFDRPTAENLHIRFDIQKTLLTAAFNSTLIKEFMVQNKSYDIGDFAETSSITALALQAINTYGGNGVPVNVEVSNNGSTWVDYLLPTTLDRQFVIDATRITITVL